MSGVRVLVGTRKGAFVLTSDAKRSDWTVKGPFFEGWEIYHVKGSPVDPNRIFASQSTGWFGQIDPALRRRRRKLGAGRQPVCLRRRAGHAPVVRRDAPPVGVRPGLAPRALAERPRHGARGRRGRRALSLDRRRSELEGALGTAHSRRRARRGSPGAGGMCLHTIIVSPTDPNRIFIAISAAGAFRTDDGGATWQPINKGLLSEGIPYEDAEVGHCVHRIALHPSKPDMLFMQKHWDVMRSDNARRLLDRNQRQPALRLRLHDRRARPRTRDRLRGADHE